eukprot:3709236-Rhodomonas_salina.1
MSSKLVGVSETRVQMGSERDTGTLACLGSHTVTRPGAVTVTVTVTVQVDSTVTVTASWRSEEGTGAGFAKSRGAYKHAIKDASPTSSIIPTTNAPGQRRRRGSGGLGRVGEHCQTQSFPSQGERVGTPELLTPVISVPFHVCECRHIAHYPHRVRAKKALALGPVQGLSREHSAP